MFVITDPRHRRLFLLAAVLTVSALMLPAQALAQPDTSRDCLDPDAPIGVEQSRLEATLGDSDPIPPQILQRSGFDRFEPRFVRALCTAHGFEQARQVARRHGAQLWRAAVDRVQGRGDAGGDLPRADDRPLYWARLQLTKALQQYDPDFGLTDEERHTLIWALEVPSRGQGSETRFPGGSGVRRMMVSGFDPFTLDPEPRRGNPSGASILALDGTRLETEDGVVFIESVILPVNWYEFDLGMVEDAFGAFMQEGPRQVHATMTISQGGNQMAIEAYNGRYRTGNDNMRINHCTAPHFTRPACQITPPERWIPFEPPQWTQTTQPYQTMIAAGTGPFPVLLRTSVTEFLVCGEPGTVSRPLGPTPGSCARSGGGGSFLSNEVAYRVTLLRDALGLDIPAGHLHIPPMPFASGHTEITDPQFEARRALVVQQTGDLVRVVAGTLFDQ